MQIKINETRITLIEGDLTEQGTDAIVNAANEALVLGGGVAGAIRKKGGPAIQKECNAIGGTSVGNAVITTGGGLKARHVIHAVGPRMGEGLPGQGDEDRKLRDATLSSLRLADEHRLHSIAFPAISTGIFGFPMKRCAEIMLQAAIDYARGGTELEEIVFCLWGEEAFQIFAKTLQQLHKE